jgi:hypothetical protein
MPTFPSPPLKFRTAGFPRYGFKAGVQTRPSQRTGLPSPFMLSAFHRSSLLCVRDDVLMSTSVQAVIRFTPGALAPIRVMLSWFIFT